MKNQTYKIDLDAGRLGREDSPELCKAIIDSVPLDHLLSSKRILDVGCGYGGISKAYVKRVEPIIGREEALNRIWLIDNHIGCVNRCIRLGFKNVVHADFLSWNPDMQFDVIIGNPPYHLPGQSMSGHKLYNEFSKLALSLLSSGGVLSFVTPISVTKKSKRFSLLSSPGLRSVDFTAMRYFDVGVKVCQWTIEDGYAGQVSITTDDGTKLQAQGQPIHDNGKVSDEFAALYHRLKSVVNKPEKRMFKQNAVDTRTCRSFTKTEECQYEMFKVKDGEAVFHQFNLPQPKLYGKKKYVVCTSKVFAKKSCLVSEKDFEVNHMFTEVESDEQVANLESFIFSPYFVEHTAKFKAMDGYGFNNAIKFLPPFDINRPWTNEEVKEFIESI